MCVPTSTNRNHKQQAHQIRPQQPKAENPVDDVSADDGHDNGDDKLQDILLGEIVKNDVDLSVDGDEDIDDEDDDDDGVGDFKTVGFVRFNDDDVKYYSFPVEHNPFLSPPT